MEPSLFYRNKVQQWCFKLLVLTCVILLIDLFVLDHYSNFSKNGGLYGIDGMSCLFWHRVCWCSLTID